MDYVRTHIKRYWGIAYRRTLGLALITLAIVLSMGLTFNILRSVLAVSSYLDYLSFWLFLIFIAVITVASSFFHSHITSVRFMSDIEHKSHSRYMAIWMVSIVLGIVAFILPLLFVRANVEPLVLLFTLGGVLWILYISVMSIFKHSYGELAIGGAAFWIMFIIGVMQLNNSSLNYVGSSNFALYFAAMSITVISGFTGLALTINSSREALGELTGAFEALGKRKRRRR